MLENFFCGKKELTVSVSKCGLSISSIPDTIISAQVGLQQQLLTRLVNWPLLCVGWEERGMKII